MKLRMGSVTLGGDWRGGGGGGGCTFGRSKLN